MNTLKYFILFALATAAISAAPTRPKDATPASSPAGDDKILIDGATNGTRALDPAYFAPAASTTTAISAAQSAAIAAAASDATSKANAAAASSQPLDSDLTAIAALATTATGRGLLLANTLTAAGLSLTNGSNIDAWGAKTIYAGSFAVTTAKTFTVSNTLTLTGTDGSTLNVGAGGTLGTNAFNSTSYQPLATHLTNFAALADGVGWLHNDGAGNFIYSTPSGGGDFSSNTSSSVDGEVVLFSGTAGKTGKRATGSGIAKLTSGVLGTATAGTDYVAPGGSAGAITVTTAAVDTNTAQASSTAFVLAQAASATPLINGTAAVGTSTRYARADHVHPTDTTRAALASPAFTGTPTAPTATVGTNTTQVATTAFVLANASGGTAANPSATIGLTANNGVATTYMRSDASPPLGVGIAPHWTGQHWFDLNPRITDNTAPTTGTSALALGTNYTLNGLTANYSFTSITGTSGRSKVHLVGCDGIHTFTWTTAAQRAGDPVGTTTTITPTAGDHTFTFYYDTVTSAIYYFDDQTGPLNLAGGATVVSGVLPSTNGGAGTVSGIMKANGSGNTSAATAGTDYLSPGATQTVTATRVTSRTNTTASSATPSINTDTTDEFTITALAAAITSMTTNLTGTPVNGDQLLIRIKDNGTARAITWGASFEACGAALPTTTVISKRLYILFIYDSTAAKWGCVSTAQEL